MADQDHPLAYALSSQSPLAWPAIPQPVSPELAFRSAVANPSVPKCYANTFTVALGAADVTLMFGVHGTASAIVSLSYPVAKILAARLAATVADFERKTETVVADIEQLEKAIQTP